MDMSDFRIIPSGMGLMMPAYAPWRAMEFAFVFAMWTVMMVGMMTPSAAPIILMYARLGRQTEAQGTPLGCNRLVQCWLFPCVGRFLATRHPGAMGT